MSLLLSQEERDRFATVGRDLITQMEKLGPHAAPIVAREKAEAAAALVIARKLRSTEGLSIG